MCVVQLNRWWRTVTFILLTSADRSSENTLSLWHRHVEEKTWEDTMKALSLALPHARHTFACTNQLIWLTWSSDPLIQIFATLLLHTLHPCVTSLSSVNNMVVQAWTGEILSNENWPRSLQGLELSVCRQTPISRLLFLATPLLQNLIIFLWWAVVRHLHVTVTQRRSPALFSFGSPIPSFFPSNWRQTYFLLHLKNLSATPGEIFLSTDFYPLIIVLLGRARSANELVAKGVTTSGGFDTCSLRR